MPVESSWWSAARRSLISVDQLIRQELGLSETQFGLLVALARKLLIAWYRLMYAGRLLYADMHPGNFLFMSDGRLGVIDFGCMIELDDTLWELMRKMDRALTTGRREDRLAAIKEWSWIGDDAADVERVRLSEEYADWSWQSRYCGGEFDFADEADYRRGVDLFLQMVRKRSARIRALTRSALVISPFRRTPKGKCGCTCGATMRAKTSPPGRC